MVIWTVSVVFNQFNELYYSRTTACLNEVKIGSAICKITSATTTRIQCSLAQGSEVLYNRINSVTVLVSAKGFANHLITNHGQSRFFLYILVKYKRYPIIVQSSVLSL